MKLKILFLIFMLLTKTTTITASANTETPLPPEPIKWINVINQTEFTMLVSVIFAAKDSAAMLEKGVHMYFVKDQVIELIEPFAEKLVSINHKKGSAYNPCGPDWRLKTIEYKISKAVDLCNMATFAGNNEPLGETYVITTQNEKPVIEKLLSKEIS